MSSALCFNLDQSKILLSGNGLTLHHTILTIVKSKEESCGRHGRKGEKGNHHFSNSQLFTKQHVF